MSELGAYGLVASLAGYLLVLRNSVASSAVRAMAGAVDRGERARCSPPRRRCTRWSGLATGVLIALRGAADRRARSSMGRSPSDARVGGLGLGRADRASGMTAPACGSTRCGPSASSCARRVTEIAAVALYLATMLALIFAGAGLARADRR